MATQEGGKNLSKRSDEFIGKTALIVGGTIGIGLEVARQLSLYGARVFVAARNEPTDLSFATFIPCDVRTEAGVENLVNAVFKEEGKIDILVNAQAAVQCRTIEKISLSDWENVMATNITSIFLLCKKILPHMKKRRFGKIVNVSSIAGRHRSPVAGVHYVASKAAIIGFSKQLAYEAAPYGINVNISCPSQTNTTTLIKGMSEEQIKRVEESIPMKRIATVEEQAKPIVFLCSEESSYMSGAVVDVNGGQI